jgi:isopropylmalate/homocitrate/citramalate synthase
MVVQDIIAAYADADADIVIIADTIGVAYPEQVSAIGGKALELFSPERLGEGRAFGRMAQFKLPNNSAPGLHMHDTYDRALENCVEAMQLGFKHYDSAIGGCGGRVQFCLLVMQSHDGIAGCPFAPGAAGNLSTQGNTR